MRCEFRTVIYSLLVPTNFATSVQNDAALNAKVQEAMSVYDEYLKNKGGDEPGQPSIDGSKPEAAA